MSEDQGERDQVAQRRLDEMMGQAAKEIAEFLKGNVVGGEECPRCGGGRVSVIEAAVDPTDETADGAPVYVVKERCDECGHYWDNLVTIAPPPDRH